MLVPFAFRTRPHIWALFDARAFSLGPEAKSLSRPRAIPLAASIFISDVSALPSMRIIGGTTDGTAR